MGPTSRNEGCGFRSEAARQHPSARVGFDREVEIGKAQRILVEEDRRIVDSNCLCCDVSIQRKIRRAEISDMSIGAGFS
jgi:hypothetical protein